MFEPVHSGPKNIRGEKTLKRREMLLIYAMEDAVDKKLV